LTTTRFARTAAPTLAAVAELTAAIDAWALALAIPDSTRRALLLVHDELASNVARHGAGARRMSIACRLDRRRNRLAYRLEDDGAPFDITAKGAPDTSAKLADRAPGGLGVHLVRTLAESFGWQRVAGENRTVVELAVDTPPKAPARRKARVSRA
jgi:anti-sigma regulatory factor (Ser/Thr protein kinase)